MRGAARPIRRRALLAGLATSPALAHTTARAAAPPSPTTAIAAAIDSIPPGPALLASYPDTAANRRFPAFFPANDGVAYVYDNALAGLALLAAGDAPRAARIADALVLAQTHDPDHRDFRLRNAYRAGTMRLLHGAVPLPGWWDAAGGHWAEDPYQTGSETGPIAWAILLWTALARARVNAARYREAATRAADWIVTQCRAPRGFTGGVFGFPPHPQRLRWTSTEQNTDLAVAFARLGRRAEAAHAARFVRAMRDPATGLFAAGLLPGGAPNRLVAADANLWPVLAGLAPPAGIAACLGALGQPRGAPAGIGFSAASQGLWTEGTGFALLALRRAGGHAEAAARFAATLRAARTRSGFLRATGGAVLSTGLAVGPGRGAKPFLYYPVPALAPTAWAALADSGHDPLIR